MLTLVAGRFGSCRKADLGAVLLVCLIICALSATGAYSSPQAPTPTAPHGSKAREAYDAAMHKLGNQLSSYQGHVGAYDSEVLREIPAEATALRLIATELGRLQIRLRQAAGQLAAIVPPGDVRGPHEALRRGVLDYADELTGVIALIRSGRLAALQTIATLKGVVEMQSATTAITDLGYAIT